MGNPVFLCSTEHPHRFDRICNSQKGGGQGNALTGLIFVLHENDTLKQVQAEHPGVILKATHGDIAIFRPAAIMFEPHGQGGALGSLVHKLQNECGLVSRSKCAALGATPTACAHKPDWLLEPTSFKNDEG